jgi:hypothetical protein
MPDGRVLLVPFNATTLRIYDPIADTVVATGTTPGSGALQGALPMLDGRVLVCAYSGSQARIYGRPGSTYNENVILSSSFYNRA